MYKMWETHIGRRSRSYKKRYRSFKMSQITKEVKYECPECGYTTTFKEEGMIIRSIDGEEFFISNTMNFGRICEKCGEFLNKVF